MKEMINNNFWKNWSIVKIHKQINELSTWDGDESVTRRLVLEDEYWLYQLVNYLEEIYDQFPSF